VHSLGFGLQQAHALGNLEPRASWRSEGGRDSLTLPPRWPRGHQLPPHTLGSLGSINNPSSSCTFRAHQGESWILGRGGLPPDCLRMRLQRDIAEAGRARAHRRGALDSAGQGERGPRAGRAREGARGAWARPPARPGGPGGGALAGAVPPAGGERRALQPRGSRAPSAECGRTAAARAGAQTAGARRGCHGRAVTGRSGRLPRRRGAPWLAVRLFGHHER
jgi:hypothetical protein